MLISWIVLAVGQLPVAGLPLVDVASDAPRPAISPLTPGEPSTFVEAAIGAALIAAYLIIARRVRSRRSVYRVSKPAPVGSGRKAA